MCSRTNQLHSGHMNDCNAKLQKHPNETAALPLHKINRSIRSVDRAISEVRRGLPVVVTTTGPDFLIAIPAEQVTTDIVDFLLEIGDASLSMLITAERAAVLNIPPSDAEVTALKIENSIDPAAIKALADPPVDLDYPLRGPFSVIRSPISRASAAAVELCKLAKLLPAVVTTTIQNVDDKDANDIAALHDLMLVTADSIHVFQINTSDTLVQVASAHVPLAGSGSAEIVAFRPRDGGIEHLAIIIGEPTRRSVVLTRLHSECFTGDLLESLRCDCGTQLRAAVDLLAKGGGGVLLYLAQEGRGTGLINKLRAYRLQDLGFDTYDANERLGFEADERIFEPAAQILRLLGISQVRLLTNNPKKVSSLVKYGIDVTERVSHSFPANPHNAHYLDTKSKRAGHEF